MPTLGTGIIPSGDIGNMLTYITRRAFIPRLVVQIYKATPTLSALLGNANVASGGISSITVPVQGNALVSGEWTGFLGSFSQPSVQTGILNAEFNLKFFLVKVPILTTEMLIQDDHEVIKILDARLADAEVYTKDTLSQNLFTTSGDSQALTGLDTAISDSGTYGGINRSTYTWWKSYKVANSPAVNPTRDLVLAYISGVVKNCGERPNFGIMGFGTWTKLASDFMGLERYIVTPGSEFEVAGGFTALMVGGVPIYPDPYMPEGTLYLLNTDYIGFQIHRNAAFAFTGFESLIPSGQLGYIGILLVGLELVCSKPAACGAVTGLNYLNI